MQMVTLLDGRVLVTGGYQLLGDLGIYNSTELFSPATGNFSISCGCWAGPAAAVRQMQLYQPSHGAHI